MAKKQQQIASSSRTGNDKIFTKSITPLKGILIHFICGSGLALSTYVASNVYSFNLVENPSQTLRLMWMVQAPVVILLYSLFRHRLHQNRCYLKAVIQGLFALPAGAVLNAFGAIVLGAPIIHYHARTLHWSLLMSVLTFVPAACLFGFSWADWHRIFAQSKANESIDYMISLPAHGAVIGAWFGAWPMPLDWERPWQEWPICVTYGAITAYVLGMIGSVVVSLFRKSEHHHGKDD